MDNIETVGRFDQVQIITTKNVTYVSAPPSSAVIPTGIWSVAGIVGHDLLIVQNEVTVRIPTRDVKVIERYSVQKIKDVFRNILEKGA